MSPRPGPATARHHVVVIGAGAAGVCAGTELRGAGIADFVILEKAAMVSSARPPALRSHLLPGCEVVGAAFDDDTDTWTLKTRGGEIHHGRVVIAAHRPIHVPWLPDFARHSNDFQGASFHASAWDRDFDPAGKHIAVIGTDATAGRYIDWLSKSAASVKVFPYPPRRVIPQARRRHTHTKRRPLRTRVPGLVRAPIDTVTASGLRTTDGADHVVDAIVYGTGFAVPESVCETLTGAGGLSIRQAWDDGMEPYLGVAVHGFPNYFLLSGSDIDTQARRIVACLEMVKRAGSTRIEVRRSSQQAFNERVHLRAPRQPAAASAFDLSSCADINDEVYDGAATLSMADAKLAVRVRLTGHFDPIDGQYHWQGTIFDSLPDEVLGQTRAVTLAVGGHNAAARITERTPWGTLSVAGTGIPPFAPDDAPITSGAPEPG